MAVYMSDEYKARVRIAANEALNEYYYLLETLLSIGKEHTWGWVANPATSIQSILDWAKNNE